MMIHVRAYSCAFVIGLVAACPPAYIPGPPRPPKERETPPTGQVSSSPAGPSSIVVTGPASIGVGARAAFSASAIYPKRKESITRRATWVSSANAVATVSPSGVVTGVSEGVASITATLSGVAGSTTVQVRPVVRGSARPRAQQRVS
jgi:hypothetical protein